jgi:acyl-CoA thioesterase-1
MTAALMSRLVRFQQPEKVLTYLGPLEQSRIAALFGLDPDEFLGLCRGFEARVREVAEALLAEPGFAELVDRLPFTGGQHVVALGESTTADRLSWFEILRQLLALRRPADGIKLTNLAVSGCTTTQALTQLPGLSFHRPDWVLCMLGANDAQRLAPGGPSLVGLAETERNLLALRDLAGQRGCERWTWLMPSTVDEGRVAGYSHFRRAGISWANEDIKAVAEILRGQPELTVEPVLTTSRADLWLDDGVHLTVDGQREVVVALVQAMANAS